MVAAIAAAMSGDQIVTPEIAEAVRKHALVGWIVSGGKGPYQGKLVARMVTKSPSVYVLVAETLGELWTMLPLGLKRAERQPADPPGMIELWW
jgi:hypothetical protein